jgi:hypothetical protein
VCNLLAVRKAVIIGVGAVWVRKEEVFLKV